MADETAAETEVPTGTTEPTEVANIFRNSVFGGAKVLRGIALLMVGGMYLQDGIEQIRSADDNA